MAAGRPVELEEEISKMRQQMPRREEMSLTQVNTSVVQTIQKRAIEECDLEAGDTADQWWLPEPQYVVIDLSGGDGDE